VLPPQAEGDVVPQAAGGEPGGDSSSGVEEPFKEKPAAFRGEDDGREVADGDGKALTE